MEPVAKDQVVHLRAAVSLLGRYPALTGVDLSVGRGEVVLVQGSNGAGKTTLLRTCAGLLPVVAGEASVLGCDLTQAVDRTAVRRRVGLLGHASGLYEDLTVADNVRFWAKACGATQDEADTALAALGLDGRLADVVVTKLSAGQRRRTSIAALVARRSELWLLDEPHAGLDQSGRDVVDRLIRSAAAAGATVIVASHELDRAGSIADRIVTIAGGTIVPPGRTADASSSSASDAPGVLASPTAEHRSERRQNDEARDERKGEPRAAAQAVEVLGAP